MLALHPAVAIAPAETSRIAATALQGAREAEQRSTPSAGVPTGVRATWYVLLVKGVRDGAPLARRDGGDWTGGVCLGEERCGGGVSWKACARGVGGYRARASHAMRGMRGGEEALAGPAAVRRENLRSWSYDAERVVVARGVRMHRPARHAWGRVAAASSVRYKEPWYRSDRGSIVGRSSGCPKVGSGRKSCMRRAALERRERGRKRPVASVAGLRHINGDGNEFDIAMWGCSLMLRRKLLSLAVEPMAEIQESLGNDDRMV